MKIGFILHAPKFRETYFADKLISDFRKQGHTVSVELLEAVENEDGTLEIVNFPSIVDYETLIFGAPIIDKKLSNVMQTYLKQLEHTEGKKAAGFVTQSVFSSSKSGKEAKDTLIELIAKKNIRVERVEIIKYVNPFLKKEVKTSHLEVEK